MDRKFKKEAAVIECNSQMNTGELLGVTVKCGVFKK